MHKELSYSNEAFKNIDEMCDALFNEFQYQLNKSYTNYNMPKKFKIEHIADILEPDVNRVLIKKYNFDFEKKGNQQLLTMN